MRLLEYLIIAVAIMLLTVIIIALLVGKVSSAGYELNESMNVYKAAIGVKSEEIKTKREVSSNFPLIFYSMASLWAGAMLWMGYRMYKMVSE